MISGPGSAERCSGSALYKGSSASGADYSALIDKYSAQHHLQPGFSGAALEFSAMPGIFSERRGLFSANRQMFSATRFQTRVQRRTTVLERYTQVNTSSRQ